MSVSLWEAFLAAEDGCLIGRGSVLEAVTDDGQRRPLDVARWCGPAQADDERALARVAGRVLDVGCGPGRVVASLDARGHDVLGIDISHSAVGLTRATGGRALLASVFGEVPHAGFWDWALLLDGNVGIGGNPVRLLRRVRDLLSEHGKVLVELGEPRSSTAALRLRLRDTSGVLGQWFPWADVSVDAVDALAVSAGLVVADVWASERGDRWFAELAKAEASARLDATA